MKYILTFLFCLVFGSSYSQYSELTTEYKLPNRNILVNIENYNNYHLRQELSDRIFYNYINKVNKRAPIKISNYTVIGELKVQKLSSKTTVLFYKCKRFIKAKN